MKYAVRKLPPAEWDALEAALWYDEQVAGLGDEFLDELDAAVLSLERNALVHSIRFDDVHCLRLDQFRYYGIYYLVRGREVWVIAVFHGARRPRELKSRRHDIQ